MGQGTRGGAWLLTPIAIVVAGAAIAVAVLAASSRGEEAGDRPGAEQLTVAIADLGVALAALAAADAEYRTALLDADARTAAAASVSPPTPPRAASAPAGAGLTLARALESYAATLGLDAVAFSECLGARATYDLIDAHVRRGSALGVRGTPTVIINDKMIGGALPAEVFTAVIDVEIVNPGASLDEYPPALRELAQYDPPLLVVVEGPPDVSDAAIEGDPEAQLIVAEFSDFECPFCKRFNDEALPAIRARLGGDVAFAFLHYPLVDLHANAAAAHAAAVCADAQGAFSAMHDLLFDRQAEWSALPQD